MKIFHKSILTSTNNVLKKRIEKGIIKEFPAFLFADYQNAGRGLGQNSWHSAPLKNSLFSIALKPDFLNPENQFLLNMALSMSVVEALRELLPSTQRDKILLKWPNDIYIENQKMGGILFELSLVGSEFAWLIMGVGINVNQMKFPNRLPNPISFRLYTKKVQDLKIVNKLLIEYLDKAYIELKEECNTKGIVEVFKLYKKKYLENLLFFKQERLYIINGKEYIASIEDVDDYGYVKLKSVRGEVFSCGLKELKYVFEK